MVKVIVFLIDGRTLEYEVDCIEEFKNHVIDIGTKGYFYHDGKAFEYYPPHRILKVKSSEIDCGED